MRIASRWRPAAIMAGTAGLLVIAAPVAAHGRKHGAVAETLRAAVIDTLRARATSGLAQGAKKPPAAPFAMPPMQEALLEHPHNKLVNFPFALALAAGCCC